MVILLLPTQVLFNENQEEEQKEMVFLNHLCGLIFS